VTYTIHRPLIRNGAIPSARGGATIVHVCKLINYDY